MVDFEAVVRKSQESIKRIMPNGFPIVWAVLIFLVAWFAFMSIAYVGKDETGQLVRVYLGEDLKEGAIIATNDEKGPRRKFFHLVFISSPFYA